MLRGPGWMLVWQYAPDYQFQLIVSSAIMKKLDILSNTSLYFSVKMMRTNKCRVYAEVGVFMNYYAVNIIAS